jgi:hypothetical protein
MVDEAPTTLSGIQAAIDDVRRSYVDARQQLEASLGRVYVDPADASDRLLSLADEFGREHTLVLFAERPHDFGVVHDIGNIPWSETAERLGEELEQLLGVHERLDDLTHARDKLQPRPNSATRTINVQGTEYQLDAEARELRSADKPAERHSVSLEPEERELSLTEQYAREKVVAPVQPQSTQERDRNRTR